MMRFQSILFFFRLVVFVWVGLLGVVAGFVPGEFNFFANPP
jgi:hypothetical protein